MFERIATIIKTNNNNNFIIIKLKKIKKFDGIVIL
jgi:hypothetical protein